MRSHPRCSSRSGARSPFISSIVIHTRSRACAANAWRALRMVGRGLRRGRRRRHPAAGHAISDARRHNGAAASEPHDSPAGSLQSKLGMSWRGSTSPRSSTQVMPKRTHRGHLQRRSLRSVRRYSLGCSRDMRLRIRRPGVRIPPSARLENGPLRTWCRPFSFSWEIGRLPSGGVRGGVAAMAAPGARAATAVGGPGVGPERTEPLTHTDRCRRRRSHGA